MPLYKNSKKLFLTKGNFKPATLFKGDTHIGGATDKTFLGRTISVTDSYDTYPSEIRILGGSPSRNLLNIDDFLNAQGNYKYYKKNENNDLVQITPDYRAYNSLEYFLELPPGTYYLSCWGNDERYISAAHNGKAISSPFTLSETSKISVKSWFRAGTVIGKFQLEKGDKPTEYEEYKEPYEPTLVWNGEEIHIPYILPENSYISSNGSRVEFFNSATSTLENITDTEFGQKLLSLKAFYPSFTASVSYGNLSVISKVNN